MKKSLAIRTASIFICFALLFGLMPTGILASAATSVSEIRITNISAPVEGKTPDYQASVDGEGYYLDDEDIEGTKYGGVTWYCGDNQMPSTDTFRLGYSYTARVEILCLDGYEFPNLNTIPVTINGDAAFISYNNSGYAILELEFSSVEPAPPALEEISINMENYTVNNRTVDLTFSSDAPIVTEGAYGENGLYYIQAYINSQLQTVSNSTFNAEKQYYLCYNLEAVGNYDISNLQAGNISLNGSIPADYIETQNGKVTAVFTLPTLEPEIIKISNLVFQLDEAPAPGKTIALPRLVSVNGGETYVNQIDTSGSRWSEGPVALTTAYFENIEPGGSFKSGKAYILETYAYLPQGFELDQDCVVIVRTPNGILEGYNEYFSENSAEQDILINLGAPTEKIKMQSYDITINGYAAGNTILTDTTLNVSINGESVSSEPIPLKYSAFAIVDSPSGNAAPLNGEYQKNVQYYLAFSHSGNDTYDIEFNDLNKFSANGIKPCKHEVVSNEHGTFALVFFKLPILHDHNFKSGIVKASLSSNGMSYKACTVCGEIDPASIKIINQIKSLSLSTTSYTYNGKEKKPSVTVKDSAGKALKKDTDYTVSYSSGRKNAGSYKATVTFKGNYTGTKSLTFKIKPVSVSKCSLKLSKTSYTYSGKAKKPSVTVKNASGTTLKKDTHYTVSYAKGRKNVGSYKVTIKMKGNYSGTKTLTFKIKPKATKISKLTAKSKSLKVVVSKQSKQVTGYEIQYSTSKKFTSAKKLTIKSYKTTSATIKKLKAKKTYYVRVRTYKTVGKTKYYSSWSSYKYKKTK